MPDNGHPARTPTGSPPGRDRYYREISARFLSLRGAPLFLSPKDLALIDAWEAAGVPLETVLEGIEDSFEARPGRRPPAGKIMALAFCRPAVERAFERVRDRSVGARRTAVDARSGLRHAAAREAVAGVLARSPSAPQGLVPLFEKALRVLETDRPDPETLERLDGEIDAVLSSLAGDEDRREAEAAVRRDHPGLDPESRAAAVAVVLVQGLRNRLRIPYGSPFYY